MIQLFAARVCLGHLNRIDDSIQFLFIFSFFIHSFCASVLQLSEKQEQIVYKKLSDLYLNENNKPFFVIYCDIKIVTIVIGMVFIP